MGKNKLKRFEENKQRENILEIGKPLFEIIKGKWNELYFKNNNDIVLELACGNGEYSVGLAEIFPNKNFIGVDIKGDRIWKGSGNALEKGLKNVAFLRTNILDIEKFFAEKEVSEIWLIHPDPRPRKRDVKRRTTHPRYLEIYRKILKDDGFVRLKTDNTILFEYTKEVLKQYPIRDYQFTDDLYNSPLHAEHHGIVTKYEKIFTEQGFKINYLKFRFDN
ncbi:MAG: tRNA (guanosine(46)-N7)-methyltransferase TrmB [Flammeovirgaceae bacterium]